MKTGAGMVAVLLGIATADSEKIIIPILLLVLGFWLLKEEIRKA